MEILAGGHPKAVIFDKLAGQNRRAEATKTRLNKKLPPVRSEPERALIREQINQLDRRIGAFQRELVG